MQGDFMPRISQWFTEGNPDGYVAFLRGDSAKWGKQLHLPYTRGQFGNYSGKTTQLLPVEDGQGNSLIRFFWDYANIETTTPQSIDLATTGIGGLVDGLAFVNAYEYLVWAFLNPSTFAFTGIGITRKPTSPWTSISTGTGVKGTSNTFVVTDAYQFVVGSKVRVQNDDASATPYIAGETELEYNWGTVTSIVDSTHIVVLLDNHAFYGYDITGTTNGMITQWDTFRPNVVSGGGATLYSTKYQLVGDIATDGAGNIGKAFMKEEEWRQVYVGLSQTFVTTFSTIFSLSRFMPLWVNGISIQAATAGVTGDYFSINGMTPQIAAVTQPFDSMAGRMTSVYVNAIQSVQQNGTPVTTLSIGGYQVAGGMRA